MAIEPSGLRVAFLTSDDGLEQVEPNAPRQATAPREAGRAYYGAVVVRGGVTEADLLRTASAAVSSVHELVEADKRVLVEADVIRGQTRTSWPSMRTDIENADGNWVESSGRSNDLPSFWAGLTRALSRRSQSA